MKIDMEKGFKITSVCRADVEEVLGKSARKFTDDDMEYLAYKMAGDYVNQLFWTQIQIIGEGILDMKKKRCKQ